MTYAAVVLAGGAARRLGGAAKPLLAVEGTALVQRVLAAAEGAVPRIAVGPSDLLPALPAGTVLTREEPPGGGPVAALRAGVALIPAHVETVVVLAGDLPFVTAEVVGALLAARAEAAVLLDDTGRRQNLLAAWRADALRAALSRAVSGAVRDLFHGVRVAEVPPPQEGPPVWLDCDTPEDLERARSLSARDGQNPRASTSARTADR